LGAPLVPPVERASHYLHLVTGDQAQVQPYEFPLIQGQSLVKISLLETVQFPEVTGLLKPFASKGGRSTRRFAVRGKWNSLNPYRRRAHNRPPELDRLPDVR